MKRILLIMTQPPGCSGVQGLRYNKLLPYLESEGWEFHFAGPSPRLVSVLTEPLDYPAERLHYTDSIPFSRRFSVEKNRHAARSLPYLFWGMLQLIATRAERLLQRDPAEGFRRGLTRVVLEADRRWNFDLIAGKTPSFETMETAGAIAHQLHKPFLALVWDPHGYRSAEGFIPSDAERQKAVLQQAIGSMFLSSVTLDRYVEAGLLERSTAHEITDSYPEMPDLYLSGCSPLALSQRRSPADGAPPPLHLIHLGVLPQWRPIEPLLDAIEAFHADRTDSMPPLHLHLFGFLYPEAQARIQQDPSLRAIVGISKSVSYGQSHWLAQDADAQLVVIGPRHVDNQPSKFFEYLGHHKPLLVIGPLANPIHAIVRELGIGVYADIESPTAILQGLRDLVAGYQEFLAAFEDRKEKIGRYSAHAVARQWCRSLDAVHRDSLRAVGTS